ncbi:TRAP transporter small permease [Paenibacillus sp. J5C_2022]|uniref:TRAP transporter small permease n=1 Tax=Paenibacillus sp. J5C2022 TaxID=2977129 RepID=UPI0021CFBA30|nr:TRAP transporter small permease [Paenibacillus sp. J5C2022]MCU6707929.1 TRAP transporter small permease [Paenibacillus sp. J5C2022]
MKATMKAINGLNKFVGIVVGLMLGAMSIIIVVQVFCRFVINFPLAWSEEAARYLMVYTVFLGAPLAIRNHKMIAIEIIVESVSPKVRKVLRILISLISIVFFVILLFKGVDMLDVVSRQSSASLGINMDIPYMAIPLGALLMIINSAANIIDFLTKDDIDTSEVSEALKAGEQS